MNYNYRNYKEIIFRMVAMHLVLMLVKISLKILK